MNDKKLESNDFEIKVEEPKELKPLMELKPEDFFPQKDSFYIQIHWVKDMNAFKFQVWTELDQSPEGHMIFNIGRGMVEAAIVNPAAFHQLGLDAAEAEAWAMNDEHKEELYDHLLKGKPANDKPV